jgi:DNA replication and repair protein RecF
VRFASITVQDFRNMTLAEFSPKGECVFVVGGNGMGKTSLLEALGLASALRSFRTGETRAMIRHGARAARVAIKLEQEKEGAVELDLTLRAGGKSVLLEGNPLPRLSDLVGRYPTTALSSQDLQLLRGSPSLRRRFLDMMLAEADRDAFEALRRFGRALAGRSRLLKTGTPAEIAAFEEPLSVAAAELVAARRKAVADLAPVLAAQYARMAPADEEAQIAYRPDMEGDADAFRARYAKARERDIARGACTCGPQLDDFELSLCGKSARDYASEGQQRGLVLALRLAEAAWLLNKTGIRPAILADDILGELDPTRRAAFWEGLAPDSQVIATGTVTPPASALERFRLLDIETILRQAPAEKEVP